MPGQTLTLICTMVSARCQFLCVCCSDTSQHSPLETSRIDLTDKCGLFVNNRRARKRSAGSGPCGASEQIRPVPCSLLPCSLNPAHASPFVKRPARPSAFVTLLKEMQKVTPPGKPVKESRHRERATDAIDGRRRVAFPTHGRGWRGAG